MKRNFNTRNKNINSFGILISMYCVSIIVSCFIYEKVVEKQYTKDGDCIFKKTEVRPNFSILQFTSINYDKIELENKTIFKKNAKSEIIQIHNTFLSGKKRIEIFNNYKSICIDSVCLFDDVKNYWLIIRKDSIGIDYYLQIEPVTYD